jgi:hypothetical protein
MLVAIGILGFVACAISWGMIVPTSKVLFLKLGTLSDMTRRAQPDLYAERIADIDPHNAPKFVHKRITRMLRADLTAFGDIPLRLQQDARNLDRKVHIGLIPGGLYFVGLALWYFLLRAK